MPDTDRIKQNTRQLEQRIKSAVDALTPDVFDRLDLSVRQVQRPPAAQLSREARPEI